MKARHRCRIPAGMPLLASGEGRGHIDRDGVGRWGGGLLVGGRLARTLRCGEDWARAYPRLPLPSSLSQLGKPLQRALPFVASRRDRDPSKTRITGRKLVRVLSDACRWR